MDLKYDSKIGRGAFGDVWRAEDALLDRTVAVKFFNDTAPTQAEMNALSHAKALVRVDSPAVVRVLSLERQRHPESDVDSLAIIMEYIDGPSLSLHREPISTELALNAIRDLTIAVEAIHSAGLVHGDLHDGNVLITPTGAKVVDILYTHSLAEVGSRTAARTRDDDKRSLAVLFRQISEKSGQDAASLEEAYYRATTVAKTVSEMRDIFVEMLTDPSSRLSPPERRQSAQRDRRRGSTSGLPDEVLMRPQADPPAIDAKPIRGVVPSAATAHFDNWIAASVARFETLVSHELREEVPHRYARGYWALSYAVTNTGDIPLNKLKTALESAQGHETGWPPWMVFSKPSLAPYAYEGTIECWVHEPSDARDGSHSDFWRASPHGELFLLRGYQEDCHPERIQAGTIIDRRIHFWRIGECLLHAQRFAAIIGCESSAIIARAQWIGLRSRRLGEVLGDWPMGADSGESRQDTVRAQVTTGADRIRSNLVALVQQLVEPLYNVFGFETVRAEVVEAELRKMMERRRG